MIADLEDAWAAFLARDATLSDHLAAAELERSAAALDAADEPLDALAARGQALRRAARWHHVEAARLLGNIGFELLRSGHLAEARRWYTRALLWDPTSPFTIEGLAETLLRIGELEAALAHRAYLEDHRYPPHHTRDFDEAYARSYAPPLSPPAPYRPSLGTLPLLDDRGLAHYFRATELDEHATVHERLRGHALACLAHGRTDHALYAARLAAGAAWWGDVERGAIERSWAAAMASDLDSHLAADGAPVEVDDAIGTRLSSPDEPFDDVDGVTARMEWIAARFREGDALRASSGLWDPDPRVRRAAVRAVPEHPLARHIATFEALR